MLLYSCLNRVRQTTLALCIATVTSVIAVQNQLNPYISSITNFRQFLQLRENPRNRMRDGESRYWNLKFVNIPHNFSHDDRYFDGTNRLYFTVGKRHVLELQFWHKLTPCWNGCEKIKSSHYTNVFGLKQPTNYAESMCQGSSFGITDKGYCLKNCSFFAFYFYAVFLNQGSVTCPMAWTFSPQWMGCLSNIYLNIISWRSLNAFDRICVMSRLIDGRTKCQTVGAKQDIASFEQFWVSETTNYKNMQALESTPNLRRWRKIRTTLR